VADVQPEILAHHYAEAGGITATPSRSLCGKPFSNTMAYLVLKGFHETRLPKKESRVTVDLPILILILAGCYLCATWSFDRIISATSTN
jgi:hypothetical protein